VRRDLGSQTTTRRETPFHLRLGLAVCAEIAERLGRPEQAAWALAQREALDGSIQAVVGDGDRFIWVRPVKWCNDIAPSCC
jgi:hypothetical protein